MNTDTNQRDKTRDKWHKQGREEVKINARDQEQVGPKIKQEVTTSRKHLTQGPNSDTKLTQNAWLLYIIRLSLERITNEE